MEILVPNPNAFQGVPSHVRRVDSLEAGNARLQRGLCKGVKYVQFM
jgi:hypothetical protein